MAGRTSKIEEIGGTTPEFTQAESIDKEETADPIEVNFRQWYRQESGE